MQCPRLISSVRTAAQYRHRTEFDKIMSHVSDNATPGVCHQLRHTEEVPTSSRQLNACYELLPRTPLSEQHLRRLSESGDAYSNVCKSLEVLSLRSQLKRVELKMIDALSHVDFQKFVIAADAYCSVLSAPYTFKDRRTVSNAKHDEFRNIAVELVGRALVACQDDPTTLCSLLNLLPKLGGVDVGFNFLAEHTRKCLSIEANIINVEVASRQVTYLLSRTLNFMDFFCSNMRKHYNETFFRSFVALVCEHVFSLINVTLTGIASDYNAQMLHEQCLRRFALVGRACKVFEEELCQRSYGMDISSLSTSLSNHHVVTVHAEAEARFIRTHCMEKLIDISPLSKGQDVSTINDVFFIIQVSVQRACVSTWPKVLQSVCCEVLKTMNVVRINFQRAMNKAVKDIQTMELGELGLRMLMEVDNSAGLVYLSYAEEQLSIAEQADYIAKITASMTHETRKSLQRLVDVRDMEAITICLTHIEESAVGFQGLSSEAANIIVQDILNTMKPIFNEVALTQYVLSEQQFEDCSSSIGWVKPILILCEKFARGMHSMKLDTGAVNAKVFPLLITKLTLLLEMHTFSHLRFNHLGALYFERQIRALISGLTTVSLVGVRGQFSRLLSACQLLTIEETHDVSEYVKGTHNTAFELNTAEIKAILSRRVDLDCGGVEL